MAIRFEPNKIIDQLTHEDVMRLRTWLTTPVSKYIAIEGPDGVGKSTCQKLLLDVMSEMFREDPEYALRIPVGVREPGTTNFANEIRNAILHKSEDYTDTAAIALAFLAARADTMRYVREMRAGRRVVISDRCWLSTNIYQHLEGNDITRLDEVHDRFIKDRPDLVIVLEADDAVLNARMEGRPEDRYEGKDVGYIANMRRLYRAPHGLCPPHCRDTVKVLHTSGTINQTMKTIIDLLLQQAEKHHAHEA